MRRKTLSTRPKAGRAHPKASSMGPKANESREESRPAAKPPKKQESGRAPSSLLAILLAPSRLGGLSLSCSRIVTADSASLASGSCARRPDEPGLRGGTGTGSSQTLAARTASTNARTFAGSFTPGALSTPLATSTHQGRTVSTARRHVLRREATREHEAPTAPRGRRRGTSRRRGPSRRGPRRPSRRPGRIRRASRARARRRRGSQRARALYACGSSAVTSSALSSP